MKPTACLTGARPNSVHWRAKMNAFQPFPRQTGTSSTAMSPSSTIARAAIAFIMTIALANTARAAAASCQQAAQHLATLIKNNWPSSDQNTPGASSDMINTLLHKSPSGFIRASEHFGLVTYSHHAFTRQALRLQTPFSPSSELLKALDELQGNMGIAGLPGTNLFAANSIGGTAYCNSTVFFLGQQGAHACGTRPASLEQRCRRFVRPDTFFRLDPRRCVHHRRQR